MALSVNNIELEGRVYKYEAKTSSIGKTTYRFGLLFWNGKDKDGKSVYSFINCKTSKDYSLKDTQNVIVKGFFINNSWIDKEGKTHERAEIIVRDVQLHESGFGTKQENESTFINDSVPF